MEETPSSYMFADLRMFGGITNKEAAKELLTDKANYGGAAPRDRINERTFLSRKIVHAAPSQVHPEFFADFSQSAQTGLRTISWTAKSRPSPATTGSRPASRRRARRLPARS